MVEGPKNESGAGGGASAGITLCPSGAIVSDDGGTIGRAAVSRDKASGRGAGSDRGSSGRLSASPSGFRRVVGFLFVLAAAYIGTMDASSWQGWVSLANRGVAELSAWLGIEIGEAGNAADAGAVLTGTDEAMVAEPATATAEDDEKGEPPAWWLWIVGLNLAWVWLALVAGLFVCGLMLVPMSRVSFVVVWALVGLVAWCVGEALGWALSWRAVVLGAAASGYLVHLWTRRSSMSLLGIFGLLLLVTGGFGATHGWFARGWLWIGGAIGARSAGFVADWGEELAWGTALLLAMLGALWSRTKTIHFLSAAVLIALSYHCVMSGRVEVKAFEWRADGEFAVVSRVAVSEGGAERTRELLTQEDVSISNVTAWRWVAALEMIVVAAVLLYKGLGVGALNVAFALAWVFLGCELYQSIGMMSLTRMAFDPITAAMQQNPGAARGKTSDPFSNMGLPVEGAARKEGSREGDVPRASSGAASASQPHARTTATHGVVTEAELAKARAAAIASMSQSQSQAQSRELALPIWIYMTAVLAGLIAVAGVGELARTEAGRVWLICALWFGLGMALVSMWFADPKQTNQTWLSWISDWTQSRYKLHAAWLAFLATLSIGGIWALRPASRSDAWLRASITCVFAGTALSLSAIAVLTRFGGFPPMPVWMWGAVAAGQSSLAWILMTHMNWKKREA